MATWEAIDISLTGVPFPALDATSTPVGPEARRADVAWAWRRVDPPPEAAGETARYEVAVRLCALFSSSTVAREYLARRGAQTVEVGKIPFYLAASVAKENAAVRGEKAQRLAASVAAFEREAARFVADQQARDSASRAQESARNQIRAALPRWVAAFGSSDAVLREVCRQAHVDFGSVAARFIDGEMGETEHATCLAAVLGSQWREVMDAVAEQFPARENERGEKVRPFRGEGKPRLATSSATHEDPVYWFDFIVGGDPGTGRKGDREFQALLNIVDYVQEDRSAWLAALAEIRLVTDKIVVSKRSMTDLLGLREEGMCADPSALEFYKTAFFPLCVVSAWRDIKQLRRCLGQYKNSSNSLYDALSRAHPEKAGVLNLLMSAYNTLCASQVNDTSRSRPRRDLPTARALMTVSVRLDDLLASASLCDLALARRLAALVHMDLLAGRTSPARPADVANTRVEGFVSGADRSKQNVMLLSKDTWRITHWKTDRSASTSWNVPLSPDFVRLLRLYLESARPLLVARWQADAAAAEDHQFFVVRPDGGPIAPLLKSGESDWSHAHVGHAQLIRVLREAAAADPCAAAVDLKGLRNANDYRAVFVSDHIREDREDVTSVVDLGLRRRQSLRGVPTTGLDCVLSLAGARMFQSVNTFLARTSAAPVANSYNPRTVDTDYLIDKFEAARDLVREEAARPAAKKHKDHSAGDVGMFTLVPT